MTATSPTLDAIGANARAAAAALRRSGTAVRDAVLGRAAELLVERTPEILAANQQDYVEAEAGGMDPSFLDRMLLTADRLAAIAADVRVVQALPDPVGEEFDGRMLPNGLRIARRRVPIGVIASVYESRPNVTVDIGVLCVKSGNVCILRGGSETLRSNRALARLLRDACAAAGLPADCVQLIDDPDRRLVGELLRMRDTVDVVIPRGGTDLIRRVMDEATMPVLAMGHAVCHTYVDVAADVEKATRVVENAKCRRTSICNALDTLLVHRDIAERFLPRIAERFAARGVEMRCDPTALPIVERAGAAGARVTPARPQDYGYEFLAPIAAVRVVGSADEALEHIARYGSGHSDAIVTEDYTLAQRFLDEVDAAAVYVNASTQFTDGGQFGLGAEIGISSQKLHARGPMGLRELTTYKWVVQGDGHTRP